MSIRNILVPALAGLLYVAGCGSTDASVGDMPSAGAAGKNSGVSGAAAGGASAGSASSVAGASTGGEGGCARFECPALVCAPGVNTPPSANGCCPGCGTGAAGASSSGGDSSVSGGGGSGGSAEAGTGGISANAGAGGCPVIGNSAIICPQTHICAAGESPTKTILCCMSCVPASSGSAGSP